MRRALCAVAAILIAAVAPSSTHAAANDVLAATPAQVRAGDVIQVAGGICPTGRTVVAVSMQTMPAWFPKGTPPFVPVDLGAIGLTQTVTGITFDVIAAQARTSLFFRVDCSDGSTASSAEPTRVYPPVGEFWWLFNSYGTFVGTPGYTFPFAASSMDCIAGTAATGSLTAAGAAAPAVSATTTVTDNGVAAFDLDLAATLTPGDYTGMVTCQGPTGPITNRVAVTLAGEATDMPPTGSNSPLVWLAVALIALGLVLRLSAGRHLR